MNTLKPINPYAFNAGNAGSNATVNGNNRNEAKTAEGGHVKKNQSVKNDRITKEETRNGDPDKVGDTEISKYIALIIKLENGIDGGKLTDGEVHQIMFMFGEKLDALTVKERKQVESSLAFGSMELDPDKSFAEQSAEKVTKGSAAEKQAVFNFLKSKEFISVLKDEPLTPPSFKPAGYTPPTAFGPTQPKDSAV